MRCIITYRIAGADFLTFNLNCGQKSVLIVNDRVRDELRRENGCACIRHLHERWIVVQGFLSGTLNHSNLMILDKLRGLN